MDQDAEPFLEPVAQDIALGELGQRRLQLDADNRAIGHALCQAKPDGADPGPEIEDTIAGRGIDGSGRQNGIDGDPVAARGLQEPNASGGPWVKCGLPHGS